MKTRILAAAFLVPALLLIVLVFPKGIASVIMGILQAVASYELLYRTRLVTKPRLVIYCAIMAFAIALCLSLDETREMLNQAGFSLTRSSKSDIVVEYCIINGNYDIFEINQVLFKLDLQPLGY